MRVFVITTVFNEIFFLPRWMEYYGKQIGPENLFIIDHGSSDLCTANCGRANVIRVPRSKFNDVAKSQALSGLHASLLSYYDGGMVVDTDEFLVADPRKHESLSAFFETIAPQSLCPIGLELLHIPEADGPFRPHLSILSQRRTVFFSTAMCKHSYSAIPTRFGGGLHSSNNAPQFNQDFYLIHAKNFDVDWRAGRERTTRSWDWSDNSFGAHARISDVDSQHSLDSLIRRYTEAVALGMDFSADINRALAGIVISQSGQQVYNDRFFSDHARHRPEEFANLF